MNYLSLSELCIVHGCFQGISLAMITIRTISFISEGRCTYVQAVSRSGRQVHVETLLWKVVLLHSILQMKCTDVHAVTSKQLYRLLHYTVQSAAQPTNDLPKSTTCPSSNKTHCSQLLLIHRMVAYSNHSLVENKMATRAMLIRDAFMLPMELLTVIPLMEQGKQDSSHHQSKLSCLHVVYQCVPYIDE